MADLADTDAFRSEIEDGHRADQSRDTWLRTTVASSSFSESAGAARASTNAISAALADSPYKRNAVHLGAPGRFPFAV
jgi:hypothetical protein